MCSIENTGCTGKKLHGVGFGSGRILSHFTYLADCAKFDFTAPVRIFYGWSTFWKFRIKLNGNSSRCEMWIACVWYSDIISKSTMSIEFAQFTRAINVTISSLFTVLDLVCVFFGVISKIRSLSFSLALFGSGKDSSCFWTVERPFRTNREESNDSSGICCLNMNASMCVSVQTVSMDKILTIRKCVTI